MRNASIGRRPFRSSPHFWIAVLCVLAGLLAAVAFLQFRSTTQIDDATEDRIGGNLESLMIDWHLDFYRRFSNICVALQVGPDSGAFDDWSVFSDRFSQWRQTAQTPQLVQNLYIWETSQKTAPRLLRLDAGSSLPSVAAPPAEFEPLLSRLRLRSGNLHSGLRAWQAINSERAGKDSAQQSEPLASDPLTGWQFDQNIPAIVHPVVHHKLPMRVDDPTSREAIDWIIIILDMRTIQTRVFPALASRHFGNAVSADYSVAVAELGSSNRVLYDSAPGADGTKIDQSDAAMNIFGPPPPSVEDNFWLAVRNANSVKVQNWRHFSGPIWFPVIRYSNADNSWMLILTHRKGHLEDLVAGVRRVNLVTNGVVLLMLAAGIAVVVIAGHRAQNYAQLQMDFVASISHELRTPLTAIYSAGENLAEGVVDEKFQLQRYGSIITSQARQLIQLVDQILTFAATRSGEQRYEMRPLEVARIVELALQNTRAAVKEAGFEVEVEIASGLPLVMGDQNAIASCIQNLLANALKYSGKSRWVRVAARRANVRDGGEIQISVEDHGIGIAASELTDVFRSFYRSPRVKVAQIHGTGLGLSVAKQIAEAMGGGISVKSSLGSGTTFTIHLPCIG
jgi:signal transduction histidine kinase